MEHPQPSKTWELSLYELHRTPQEAITDNTEIAVSPRSLHSELMCPICLDMLKNTMTTKECLHRYGLIFTFGSPLADRRINSMVPQTTVK